MLEVTEAVNSQRQSGAAVARGWGRGRGSWCLMDAEFQFGKKGGFLELDGEEAVQVRGILRATVLLT